MVKRLAPSPNRLTPAQFKALAKYKGWTYRLMAERWGIQPESLSAIARNPDRPARYDDMLHGLPNLNRLGREVRRQTDQLAAAMARFAMRAPAEPQARPATPGYRYHGYLTTGAIVVATTAVGSIAEEGVRGVVFDVQDDGTREVYGVLFESGLWDWFPPDYVDIYMADIGVIDAGASGYQYTSEEALQADFEGGRFEFWPSGPSAG